MWVVDGVGGQLKLYGRLRENANILTNPSCLSSNFDLSLALKRDDKALGPGAYIRQMESLSVREISNNDNHRCIPYDNVSEWFGSKKKKKTVLGELQWLAYLIDNSSMSWRW